MLRGRISRSALPSIWRPPEADLKLALKFLDFMKSISGAATPFARPAPAALGAPPREASASVITSGLLTLPGAGSGNSRALVGSLQVPSTPGNGTCDYSDQLGLDRDPRSLPPA